jgi:ribosome-associated heat shock protein Hsp15
MDDRTGSAHRLGPQREPATGRDEARWLVMPGNGNEENGAETDASDGRGERTPTGARVDQWLDVACLFKTRSEAQKACRGGKVEVNRQAARPNRLLRPGDEVRITRAAGRRQIVVVRGFAARHVPKAEARTLYEDLTPPPTPEELETRRLMRALGPQRPSGPVTTRQKRASRRLKEGGR